MKSHLKSFKQVWEAEKERSLRLAQDYLDEIAASNSRLNPSMKRLLSEIRVYLLRGGKWNRPWLVRLAVKLLNTKLTHNLYLVSLSTEFLHRFLLVHDDIIDQDLKRHGGPTLQKIYQQYHHQHYAALPDHTDSLGKAIIGGDLINILTANLILDSGLSQATTLNFLRAINQDSIETVAGFVYEADLKQKTLDEVKESQVITAMKQVSAAYSLVWPLRLGEILAGRAYGDWLPELDTFGVKVGLAFQIQDDILAIFGNTQDTGKPVGNDIREGKKTLLTCFTYAQADLAGRKLLQNSLHHEVTSKRLQQIQKLMEQTGALQYARHKAQQYAKQGVTALLKLKGVNPEVQNSLIDLADYLSDRAL